MSQPPENMMDDNSSGSIDEQAALWFIRQRGQSLSEQQKRVFQEWLSASPEHQAAYQNIAQIWRDCDLIPKPEFSPTPKERLFSWWRPIGHTVASLFLLAALLLPYSQLPAMLMDNMTLATNAQSKKMILPDGSEVFLNQHSQLRVAYRKEQRQVWLDSGEAYFKVASNPYRPFYVNAGGREIKVVGTEFDIRRKGEFVAVAVRQGIVAVKAHPDAKEAYLHAGDTARSLALTKPLILGHSSIDEIGDWRYGQLRFHNRPLADLLAELKHYYPTSVEFTDPKLAQLKVSGTINLSQPEQFFEALPVLLPVNVTFRDKNNIVISTRK